MCCIFCSVAERRLVAAGFGLAGPSAQVRRASAGWHDALWGAAWMVMSDDGQNCPSIGSMKALSLLPPQAGTAK